MLLYFKMMLLYNSSTIKITRQSSFLFMGTVRFEPWQYSSKRSFLNLFSHNYSLVPCSHDTSSSNHHRGRSKSSPQPLTNSQSMLKQHFNTWRLLTPTLHVYFEIVFVLNLVELFQMSNDVGFFHHQNRQDPRITKAQIKKVRNSFLHGFHSFGGGYELSFFFVLPPFISLSLTTSDNPQSILHPAMMHPAP